MLRGPWEVPRSDESGEVQAGMITEYHRIVTVAEGILDAIPHKA